MKKQGVTFYPDEEVRVRIFEEAKKKRLSVSAYLSQYFEDLYKKDNDKHTGS